ncbi:MAG: methylenetetrahydrofolate--tRNA-(uracil(54)-C(5))-methyltransferase (FADH(2)-oxidizing) TrmFO [Nitrospinales bacterium]
MNKSLTIIGAGLAGSEAAWQAAQRGIRVVLYEMRPKIPTPVHKSDQCAELVCSNSLGSNLPGSAPSLLKEELRNLQSLVIQAADHNAVPAGSALAVNREGFAKEITQAVVNHPNITLKREEVAALPSARPLIIATGPLTSSRLSEEIARFLGQGYLYFYDALSPIVDAATIDYQKTFFASRYNKGTADYLNCPMNKTQYRNFIHQLRNADKVPLKSFEKPLYFEGCMPIEELALRDEQTLAFGPLKPVGLPHPETGEQFHAVVQLRKENKEGTAYNLVGFQTKLTYPEQRKVFATIPGLEKAEFFRYGAIHRNTFINTPALMTPSLSLRTHAGVYFAGQIVGVEGYVESCAMGAVAALSAVKSIKGEPFAPPPPQTAIGALLGHVVEKKKGPYQPMNINFGLFLGNGVPVRDKKQRNRNIIQCALDTQSRWLAVNG